MKKRDRDNNDSPNLTCFLNKIIKKESNRYNIEDGSSFYKNK